MSQLCDNLRYGVRIGFEGERTPSFSKKKIAYCRCPYKHCHFKFGKRDLPWPRGLSIRYSTVQVSQIGLVPKKNSDNFRTIFHLSFPNSGTTSINSSISKEYFSLQFVTIDNVIERIKRFGQGCFGQGCRSHGGSGAPARIVRGQLVALFLNTKVHCNE